LPLSDHGAESNRWPTESRSIIRSTRKGCPTATLPLNIQATLDGAHSDIVLRWENARHSRTRKEFIIRKADGMSSSSVLLPSSKLNGYESMSLLGGEIDRFRTTTRVLRTGRLTGGKMIDRFRR
jgi:hypothetical protein